MNTRISNPLKNTTFLIAMISLGAVVGCGGSDLPPLGQVSGVVKLDGNPLEGAEITFQPAEGRPSIATTDKEGKYTLIYTDEANGAVLGEHTVYITTARAQQGGEGDEPLVEAREELLPARYHEDSQLKKEVKAGSQEINFDLSTTEA